MTSINCKELFALGVRLFGIWLVVRGLFYVETFVDSKLYPNSDQFQYRAAGYLIYAAIDFALAAFFLFWTNVVVAWTYGDELRAPQGLAADEENAVGPLPSDSPT